MTPKIPILKVHGQVGETRVFLGELSYSPRLGGAFQWSKEALDLNLEWSPLHCPLSQTIWTPQNDDITLLDGIPGFIHDALPDGWGLLLMDRMFTKKKIAKSDITPLLRLSFLGDRSWGALSFEPLFGDKIKDTQKIHLGTIFTEAKLILNGTITDISEQILITGGSPQGARPKIFVMIDESNKNAVYGGEVQDYRHVMIKFAGQGEDPTAPLLEYAFIKAAEACGVQTMPATLLDLDGNYGLCTDRFDRLGSDKIHAHSLAGMLHTSHRIANTDWVMVGNVLDHLSAEKDKKEALRRALFNAMFSVRDDHTKNIAFLRDGGGHWSLSPAFDIAYSQGPGGYHTMTYAGHTGAHVKAGDMERLTISLKEDPLTLLRSIGDYQDVRRDMEREAKGLGVSKNLLRDIRLQFKEIDKEFSKKTFKKSARIEKKK